MLWEGAGALTAWRAQRKSNKEAPPGGDASLLLLYRPYNQPIPTLPGFNGTFYPPGMETVPKWVTIIRANRQMVDHINYLIAYAWYPTSNARDLRNMPKERGHRATAFKILRKSG